MRFRIGLAVLAVTGASVIAAPAHSDEVHTLTGPGAGDSDMFVTYVGCDAFFAPAAAPRTRLNLGPAAAPSGRRSLGLVPQGTGTASGPYTPFSSLAGIDASVAATSATGSTGASYIWTITPDTLPGTAWSGRAETTVPAGGWHDVAAARLVYTWTLVDLATRQPVSDTTQATPAQFAADHGDGKGYVVTGFGCDGNAVNIDTVRSGATTWDFEGVTLATAIAAGAAEVPAGTAVTITGQVSDASGRVTGDPLVLETRTPGGAWRPVGARELVDADGTTRVEVTVREPGEYRWHRPESEHADEGWSEAVTIGVVAPQQGDDRSGEGGSDTGGEPQGNGTGRQ